MANNASNIELNVKVKNEKLNNLTEDLAKTRLETQQLKTEIKALEKATQGGTRATQEQTRELVQHYKALEKQEAVSKSLKSSIKELRQEIKGATEAATHADGGVTKLAKSLGLADGFTTTWSVALGRMATSIATTVVTALGEMAYQVVDLGAKMQQTVAQLNAMTGGTDTAIEAYRALNDVSRNTFDEAVVFNMGEQLMRLGYSAQNAAGLIQLCADAAAGLGTGQQGAQQLVDAISRMQAVGELTSRQMQQLKVSGIDMDAAFASLHMTGEEAMKAVEEGTLDAQQAIGALTDYLHQFDGKMAESKDNVIDAWGDVTENLSTVCAEIGNSLFDAFNQSEIVQKLIDFTEELIYMVRSDATGAFTDLKEIAGEVLDFIGGLLGFVLDTIKLIIVILHDAYAAFKSFGAQVVDAIRPAVDIVLALYDAVKAVLSSVGKNFGSEVGKSFRATFDSGLDPEERAERRRASTVNNFRQRSYSGGRGRSGGGGGGATKALSEEEKAVEALIKKYADASKQKWSLAKSAIELAKTNLAMLSQEVKVTEERNIKLQALQDAHDQMMEGYQKELTLAGKIQNASIRENTINSINEQIDAENKLFEAKKRRVEFESERAARDYQATAFSNEMEHLQNLFTMQDIHAGQRIEMENQVLQARKAQLQEMLTDASLYAEDRIKIERQLADTIAQINANAAYDMKTGWQQALVELANQQVNFKDTFTSAFSSIEGSLVNLVSSTGSAKDKFKQFCQDITNTILKSMAQIIIKGLITRAIMGAIGLGGGASVSFGGFGNTNWSADPFGGRLFAAGGGYIKGPGSGTSDSIPAMLSNGEYVIRSAAVDRIGIATLNRLNRVGHFADGGYVGSGGGWGAPPVVINLHNESGIPMEAEQNESQFDGESYVIGVVLNAVATNKMGMGSLLKGARA